MSFKLFTVVAAVCAVLLATHPASCEDFDVQQPDLYILNPDSVFPIIVTDPSSPLLENIDPQVTLVCYVQRCQQRCRSFGYKYGRCNSQAICICSNR